MLTPWAVFNGAVWDVWWLVRRTETDKHAQKLKATVQSSSYTSQ